VAPLLVALRGASPRRALLLGYVAGSVQFAVVLYWIAYVTTTYGGMSWLAGCGVAALLVGYLAIYHGLFGLGLVVLTRAGVPQWLAAAPLWTALEFLRGFLFTGFPWAELGASQFQWTRFIQAADLGGVALLSFIIVLANAAVAAAWPRPARALAPGLAALVTLSLGLTYGDFRERQVEALAERAPHLSVAIVQGSIEQGLKWLPGMQQESVRVYSQLTGQAARRSPELIVWPETALPFYFLSEDDFTPAVLDMARGLKSYLLLGCPAYERREGEEIAYFNRAWLLAPGGQPAAKYDKVHLVPYGEYVPLKRYMPFLGQAVANVGCFDAGAAGCPLPIAGSRPARVGVLICFESIFSDLARDAVRGGATLLAVITNDAWFGRTSAPYQHFSMSVLRAVETRRAVVRAANTGVSGLIAPDGRVLASTGLYERRELPGRVPLMGLKTVYTTIGDAFAWACLALSLGLSAWALAARRQET
jgi:apolipoprotein N-acyltransferase